MYKSIILALLILTGINIEAQQIKKESIDSGGGIATGDGIVAIHTIGETVVQEKSEATLNVSEGFISSDLLQGIGIQDFTLLEGVTAYPNPTTDVLKISFPEMKNYNIQVFDLLGKEILDIESKNQEDYELDLSSLETATYSLVIINNVTKQFKTFKIIKK